MIPAHALVLALLQAEPAPPEPPPAPGLLQLAQPVQPEPAPPPVTPPVAPPPTLAPGAAPPPMSPPVTLPPTRFNVGLVGGVGVRLGPGSDNIGPRVGYSVGLVGEYVYLRLSSIELGAGVDALYDQYSTGDEDTYHVISHTSFVALLKAAMVLGPVRPWVGGGGGVTIGYFHSDEIALQPGNQTTTRAAVRAAAGVDIGIRRDLAITVRVHYTWLTSRPTFTTNAGVSYQLFSDLLDVGGGILYRF